ncbi:MAG: sugar phosphate isomerase/epimerase family protein [Pirellulaceae bacterium]
MLTRREAIQMAVIGVGTAAASRMPSAVHGADDASAGRGNRIAVSTYSFWQFRHQDLRDVEACIRRSAEMGFDGVEILHRQRESEDNGYLQRLKRTAFVNGVDLCGFSTHQGFLSPDENVRQKNIDHTIRCIELAYKLGIPTIRVNTGTWGTSKNFVEGREDPRTGIPKSLALLGESFGGRV